jgi:hypothetical protein
MKYSIPVIHNKHDSLFYQVFSRKEKARAFFEKYLPPAILAVADLDELTIVESKHISDAGLSLYNDVLYRCPLGKGQIGYFFLMNEHQSKPYKQMPLRLIKYDISAIEDHLKQGHKHYPVVINIVLYTGKTPWNYSTAFDTYYTNPALGAQFLSMAPFTLIALPTDEKHPLYTDKDLGFCLAAFYCGRSKDVYKSFVKFKEIPAFQQYFERLPVIERELVGRYLGLCVDRARYSLEEIVNLIITNDKEKEIFMRSVAQEYFEQGIFTKAIEVARIMLQDKEPIEKIIKWTGLGKDELERMIKLG